LAQENTDLIGFLGGSLKRKYLQTSLNEFGKKSMEYYGKGLEISTQKNDYDQIYYHAINLAFLSLVYADDKNQMRQYAQQAISATEKVEIGSMWKNATIAEASMYSGDFKKAMEYYALAAELAGIHDKIFIHNNAYISYTCLMETKEDDFTKFLKIKFLT